jgi:hypothetical protein
MSVAAIVHLLQAGRQTQDEEEAAARWSVSVDVISCDHVSNIIPCDHVTNSRLLWLHDSENTKNGEKRTSSKRWIFVVPLHAGEPVPRTPVTTHVKEGGLVQHDQKAEVCWLDWKRPLLWLSWRLGDTMGVI